MKTPPLSSVLRCLFVCGLSVVAAGVCSADILVSSFSGGKISRYRNDGSLVKSSFITGLSGPTTIHVTNDHIFVADTQAGSVNRYKLDGTPSKVPFVSGLSGPIGMTSDGFSFFVANFSSGKISKYNLSTGAAVNTNFITSLGPFQGLISIPGSLVVTLPDAGAVNRYSVSDGVLQKSQGSGFLTPTAIARDTAGNLFISDSGSGSVGKYDTDLDAIDAEFITTGLQNPTSLAFVGNDLAVVNNASGKVALYSASGKLLKGTFIDAGEGAIGISFLKINTPYPQPKLGYTGKKSITTGKATITLKGTSTNATVVQVKLPSGKTVELPKASPWSYKAKLNKGKNRFVITSRGTGGTSKALTITVTRKAKKASAAFAQE
ncbi:MAG: hypothetical protein EOP88_02760 [Verrucomicrobiaceae bacterium]|nr:MAG: hypothetical protein EOP88_02760 [Verrucomicrobiaceae bacterium]